MLVSRDSSSFPQAVRGKERLVILFSNLLSSYAIINSFISFVILLSLVLPDRDGDLPDLESFSTSISFILIPVVGLDAWGTAIRSASCMYTVCCLTTVSWFAWDFMRKMQFIFRSSSSRKVYQSVSRLLSIGLRRLGYLTREWLASDGGS